jgi:hypothetical protein
MDMSVNASRAEAVRAGLIVSLSGEKASAAVGHGRVS